MKIKKNLFFDMDGVFVIYDPSGYIVGDNKTPAYLKKGEHYFARQKQDEKMVRVLQKFCEDDEFNVKVLTKITKDGDLYIEHVEDKKEWLCRYCPFIDVERQFMPVTGDKAEVVNSLLLATEGRGIGLQDGLIEDYNGNIVPWAEKGGRVYKYMNTINSPSTRGDIVNLPLDMTADDIYACIKTDMNNLDVIQA